MTGIDSIVNEPAVQAIGWALVHFVWQGTLIALIAAAALRLLRQSAADVRYVVATIALALMATLPVVTGLQVWRGTAAEASVSSRQQALGMDTLLHCDTLYHSYGICVVQNIKRLCPHIFYVLVIRKTDF